MSTPSQPVPAALAPIPRPLQLGLFFVGCLWLIASGRAAEFLSLAFVTVLNIPAIQPLLEQLLLLVLLLGGFWLLSWTSIRSRSLREVNALPRRATAGEEWLRGAALGWAMLLAAVIPIVLAGDLHPQFWMQPRAWWMALISLLTVAVGTLTLEVAYRGYLYTKLIATFHPVAATALMATLYAIVFGFHDSANLWSTLTTFLMGILLSIAYLRTHGLWLGWGLHFAWLAAMGLVFGLPVPGYSSLTSLVATDVSGSPWFTGGVYGPERAFFTFIVVLAAIPVLYRITRGYAWDYTHSPIVAAGRPMEIQPPAAHTAMEAAAAPAPLVQILGATPTNPSTMPVIEEHLRSAATSPGENGE